MNRYALTMLSLAAAATLSACATGTTRSELRADRQDVREQRAELRDAVRTGDPAAVREESRDVRDAQRELQEDRQAR